MSIDRLNETEVAEILQIAQEGDGNTTNNGRSP
jgi:hypothetical protein